MEKRSQKSLGSLLVRGREHSVLSRFVVESMGPFRSFGLYLANTLSHGRIRPDLSPYFTKAKSTEAEEPVPLERAHAILHDIDVQLQGEVAIPENFIGSGYHRWTALKNTIAPYLDENTSLTDYTLTNDKEGCHYIFAVRNTQLLPIKIDESCFDEGNLKEQLSKNSTIGVLGDTGDTVSAAINAELLINDFRASNNIEPAHSITRRLCSITNDFPCHRNQIFEREGEMFTGLRHRGARSIGESQELHRVLFSQGVFYDTRSESIAIDTDFIDPWVKLRTMSLGNTDTASATSELYQFARENVYFRVVHQYFKENPQIVNDFLKTAEYRKYVMPFKDRNLSALGLTERACAENMLANYYLSVFDGGVEHSSSQVYLARIPGFHENIGNFVATHAVALPLFEIRNREEDQANLIHASMKTLRGIDYPFTKKSLDEKQKAKVLAEAQNCFPVMRHEMDRNEFNQVVLNKVENSKKPIPISRKGLLSTAIANVGLAKVPGEGRYTESSWFPNAGDYLPKGKKQLPPVPIEEGDVREAEIIQSIKNIFNGKTDNGQTPYDSQESRIFNNASQIFTFLQNSEDVPGNVKNFIKTVGTTDLAVRILERFGPIADNDPLIINRFFPEGFEDFQKSAVYRYIFDFVRGVETNIILSTSKSSKEKIMRRFGGRWENLDFSRIPDEIVSAAIKKTVKNGGHRISVLNHERGVKKETLKDWQEYFEKIFGWDTLDMWFLRWEPFWNVWNSLGGAWDCICFSRKDIFNPGTLQQW